MKQKIIFQYKLIGIFLGTQNPHLQSDTAKYLPEVVRQPNVRQSIRTYSLTYSLTHSKVNFYCLFLLRTCCVGPTNKREGKKETNAVMKMFRRRWWRWAFESSPYWALISSTTNFLPTKYSHPEILLWLIKLLLFSLFLNEFFVHWKQ